MSCGGGGSGSTNTVVQQSQIPPSVQAAYDQLTSRGFSLAGQPLQQYTGSLVAPFSPEQEQAFQEIGGLQDVAKPYQQSAQDLVGNAEGTLGTAAGYYGGAANYINDVPGYLSTAAGYYGGAANYINDAPAYVQGGAGIINTGLGLEGQGAGLVNQAPEYVKGGAGIINKGLGLTDLGAGVLGTAPDYLKTASQYIGQAPGYFGAAASEFGQAPNFAGNISTYENPYTTNVTQALQNLYNQQNATQQAQVEGNAVSSNAWGGDRSAVAQALTAGQQNLTEAPTFANVLSQGYQQAVQAAQAQAWLQSQAGYGLAGLGTGTAGLGATTAGLGSTAAGIGGAYGGLGAQEIGAGTQYAGLGTTLGGLGATLSAIGAQNVGAGAQYAGLGSEMGALGGQYANLGAGTAGLGNEILGAGTAYGNLGAGTTAIGAQEGNLAGLEGNLGSSALTTGLTAANALAGVGGQRQQLAQENLNVPYEQFVQQQAYPYQQLSWLAPMVEGTGSLSGGTGTTTYPGPSIGSQLTGLGLTGIGAYGLLNNAGLIGGAAALTPEEAGIASGFGSAFGAGAIDLGALGPFAAVAARGGRIGRRGLADGGSSDSMGPDDIDLSFILPDLTAQSGLGPDSSSAGSNPLASLQELGAISGLAGLAGVPGSYQEGGTVPGGPLKIPSTPPEINLDYLVSPGPTIKGQGPPKPPAPPAGAMGDTNPQQILSEEASISHVLKGLGDGTSAQGAQFGGNIGRRGPPHMGGMGLGRHRGMGFGLEHAPAAPGIGGGRKLGLPAIHLHLQTGGMTSPLATETPITGASPVTQGYYSQLSSLPVEKLQEYAARVPPGSSQGALIQRALQMKRMQLGSGSGSTPPGTAAAMQSRPQTGSVPGQAARPPQSTGEYQEGGAISPVSFGQSPTAPGLGGMMMPQGGTAVPASGMPGLAEGGEIEHPIRETDDMDDHPIVDHSGPTVIIHYPSEKRSLDLGLPSSQEMRERYQGGGTVSGIPGVQLGLQALRQPMPAGVSQTLNPALYSNGGPARPTWQAPSATDAATKAWGLADGGRAAFQDGGDTDDASASAPLPPPIRDQGDRDFALADVPSEAGSLDQPLPQPRLTAHSIASPAPSMPSPSIQDQARAPSRSSNIPMDRSTPLADVVKSGGTGPLVDWLIKREGRSPAGVINNPGNIKYAGLPGQSDSGVHATDGGTYASYDTPESGRGAIANLIHTAASGQSRAYGTNPSVGSFTDIYGNIGGKRTAGAGAEGDIVLPPGGPRYSVGFTETPAVSPTNAIPSNLLLPPREPYQPGLGASPWMALLAAGLGTMAGRSPHALTNIGAGGLEGVKVLQQQEKEHAAQDVAQGRLDVLSDRANILAYTADRLNNASQARIAQGQESLDLRSQRNDAMQQAKQAQLELNLAQLQAKIQLGTATQEEKARQNDLANQLALLKLEQAKGMQVPTVRNGVAGTALIRPGMTQEEIDKAPFLPGGVQETRRDAEIARMATANREAFKMAHDVTLGGTPLKPGETIPNFQKQAEEDYARRHGAEAPAAAAPTPTPSPQNAIPPMPSGVPAGSQYSPSRKMWRDPQGKIYDENGKPVP